MSKDMKIGLLLYLGPVLIGAAIPWYLTTGYTRLALLVGYVLMMALGFVAIMNEVGHRELIEKAAEDDKKKWEERIGN